MQSLENINFVGQKNNINFVLIEKNL